MEVEEGLFLVEAFPFPGLSVWFPDNKESCVTGVGNPWRLGIFARF